MYKKSLLFILSLLCITSCGSESSSTDTDSSSTSLSGNESKADESNKSSEEGSEDEKDEPKISTITVGNIRIQLLSETLFRVEAKRKGKFEDRPSYAVTNRTNWDTVEYTQKEENGHQVITTDSYIIYAPIKAKDAKGVYVTDKSGNKLWNFETVTNSNVYLPSPSEELASWYFADSPRVIPSENGYALPEGKYQIENGWETHSDATDLYVFLPNRDYRTFAKDFISLTGSAEMLPLNLFGFWDSRYYEYTAETALAQVKDYLSRGYSIDVLVIDTDWRDASNGVGYQINTELFPDMKKFFEEVHKLGVDVFFNDHPEPVENTDSLLDKEEIKYRNENLKLILSLGLDYWWYDRNWSVELKPIADNLSIYSTGMYAFQFITEDYYKNVVKDDPKAYARRAIIMGNVDGILHGDITYAPDIASHRFPLQWTGDIKTDKVALGKEIYDAIYGGVELGLPYLSSDLGGHVQEVTKEMYVRWIQYGALSTICRVHCTKPFSRMPWLYGETAEAVTKEYVGMRYRLLPLYYALAHENYTSGLPIMRRLDINYPQYVESQANDQYLLGDYILVAPYSGDAFIEAKKYVKFSNKGKNGLKVEYFKNNNLEGEPAYTGISKEINFEWGQGGPEEIGISDNFSARWTGEFTVLDEDTKLVFFADDGVRVWVDNELVIDGWHTYDQYLSTDNYKAKSKHSIKIEYCELTGGAHIFAYSNHTPKSERKVFIPDGTWMDVWTGETITGPKTITVDCPLETSPIYVRAGSIVALAENMKNTSEKNWSNMTLDVYPSKDYSAKTTIYEDDTKTVAYKDGQYRTTDISMEYTDALTINIDPAKGTFVDDFRGFEERTFNVRLHAREDFGAIQKITLNGNEIAATIHQIADDASPFAFSGASRDSVIYEISFTTNIRKANQIKVFFENPTDDGKNEKYDTTPVEISLKSEKISKRSLNLTSPDNLDYALFGFLSPNTVLRMKDGKGLIGNLNSDADFMGFTDNYTISWSNGDIQESGESTNGPVSKRNFSLTLKTTEGKNTFTIYLGGFQSSARFTVRDKSGNVETIDFGDMTTNYYRKVTIECTSDSPSEIYISYAQTSGNNITFSAVTAK